MLTLQLLANPITATEANCKGINYVINRMDWYWSLSSSLLEDPADHGGELSGARRELENQIVDLYRGLLSYQVKSVCSYYRNRSLASSGTWSGSTTGTATWMLSAMLRVSSNGIPKHSLPSK
jgi:hypothetical protein